MDIANLYSQGVSTFIAALSDQLASTAVDLHIGRRFDRVLVNGQTRFFVDKSTWEIFGAKSSFQYNPRRQYGKLDTVEQFNWADLKPLAGSAIETEWLDREAEIQKQYKPRGRPKKQIPAGV